MSNRIVWCFCALMAALVVTSPVACTVHTNNRISEAIEKGADPLEARCAMEMGNPSAVCIATAVRGERK